MQTRSLEALPSKLHLAILKELFRETIISFEATLEKQHELCAILLMRRGSYNVAQHLLKRSITLHFVSTKLMLQVLLPMSPEDRGQFRHMRVRGYAGPIGSVVYPFNTALCMLSGLRLDTLLVGDVYHNSFIDSWGDTGTRDEVDALVVAKGWRQLLFYTPTSGMLGHNPSQLAYWQQCITDCDAYEYVSLFRGIHDDTGMAAGPHRYNTL